MGFFGGLDGNDDSDAPMDLKIEAIIPILRVFFSPFSRNIQLFMICF